MAGLVPAIHAVRRDAIVLKGGGLNRVSYCTKPVDPRLARGCDVDGRDTPGSQSGGGHDTEGVGEAQMTSVPIAVIAGVPISLTEALGAALSLLAVLAALSLIALWRAGSRAAARAGDRRRTAGGDRGALRRACAIERGARRAYWGHVGVARVAADGPRSRRRRPARFGRGATRRRARKPKRRRPAKVLASSMSVSPSSTRRSRA